MQEGSRSFKQSMSVTAAKILKMEQQRENSGREGKLKDDEGGSKNVGGS